ncbi:MAG TPA: hypothetical protein VI485_07200 [Vicinamibacterales bacterium]|nr:hypothetical protein [Vicinamibacterales bacterium]
MRRKTAAGVAAGLVIALSLQSLDARPQAAAQASGVVQNGIDADRLVTRYFANADEYHKTFRNLVAEETKIIEVYRASGEVEKRRHIVSDLLVYNSARDGARTTEYRDVRSVDGKAVEKRGERALKLLTNASRADSLEKELRAINRETFRYEFDRHLQGWTVNQNGVSRQWRELFQVEWSGREQVAGHDVVVLNYRQTAPIPGAGRSLPVPKEFGRPAILSRGRLWLDAQTGQLWRSVWELVVPHPAIPEPLAMVRAESTYTPSRFGILVPERIVFDWFSHFSHPKKGRPSLSLSERTTFSYGSFRRFDVATDENIQLPEAR